jgi:phosphatidylserine/phosphatidylglycerophosphate/cardiolipin synthase-like enzyme
MARSSTNRDVVYIHGICRHERDYSKIWWEAMHEYVKEIPDGNRHEVLWSDVIWPAQAERAETREERLSAARAFVHARAETGAAGLAMEIKDLLADRALRELSTAALPHAGRALEDSPQQPTATVESAGLEALLAVPQLECIDDFVQYLWDREIRDAVIDRFNRVLKPLLQPGNIVEVISHSWGTVVAYEALRLMDQEAAAIPDRGVHTLFTVGSALAIAPVRRRLLPEASDGRRPRVVQSWVNLNARSDVIGGRLRGNPFEVDFEYLNLAPVGCPPGFQPRCAHSSYFHRENVAVNRDIFARHIKRSDAAIPTGARRQESALRPSAPLTSKRMPATPEALQAFQDAVEPELVGRNCRLEHYDKIDVPDATSKEMIAYASPDSAFAVTKCFLDSAKKSILIGIYDFTAGYIKEMLLKAMRRGVKVTLMLDLDGRTGETELFRDLVKHGCDGVPAPSCASKNAHYFASSHEKVIVIDDSWTLVQSGNFTENSVPQNEKDSGDPQEFVPGNRDTGIAVRSEPLARFFSKVLRSDMKLELDAAGAEALLGGMATLEEVEALQAAPALPPAKLFASKRFAPSKPVRITPVLSPDNYMDVIPDFLGSATKSITIEQQYIRGEQPLIKSLLETIVKTRKEHRALRVRIIVAKPFPGGRFDKEAKAIKGLSKFGLKLGTNVRILNPKRYVHCHNKLIIVDDRAVLVSSQNWSDFAVSKNREAGLLIENADIARYFAGIFQTDWDTGLKVIGKRKAPELFGPQALATGKTVPLSWGDYAEV